MRQKSQQRNQRRETCLLTGMPEPGGPGSFQSSLLAGLLAKAARRSSLICFRPDDGQQLSRRALRDGLHEGLGLEVSAGGIVLATVDRETYVALVQRTDGRWALPKGHQKLPDKDLRATAVREVSEEIGLDRESIQVGQKLDAYISSETFGAHHVRKTNHFFVMWHHGVNLPRIKPDADHIDARWWKISETLPDMYYAHQRTLLAETLGRLFGSVARFHE